MTVTTPPTDAIVATTPCTACDFRSAVARLIGHAARQDGLHYHFTSKPQMEKEIADGQFLEYAHVHSNIYGTSVAAVRDGRRQRQMLHTGHRRAGSPPGAPRISQSSCPNFGLGDRGVSEA